MTSDGLAVLQALFGGIWSLFTSWKIPGTDTTPGAFFLFLILASIGLRFVVNIFSTNVNANVTGSLRTFSRNDKK